MVRAKGQPAILGRIMAVFLLEGRELSHKEISDLTGYSISSVSRTLDQMVRMGIVHKHKDASMKHFVFHVSVDFSEMLANSLETMIKVYEAQREEMKNLMRKVSVLKSKGKEQVEINRLQTTLKKFEKAVEFFERVLKSATKELRSNLREL
ncbi:MAG: ArsR family transcriptional regulator [Candidatus Bathyarchaeota archaeon]|nr:ArsR family transcriptional regulator [Candidatus Bathyarchaeota archaeon]MDH5532247.1 ArsR family transcriptional regulator [Candidatus Bathyarchaeota archaeon]